jgi:HEAT repeats
MSLVWWLWLFAACVLAVSICGFILLLIDRIVRNRRSASVAISRAAILSLLANGRLTNLDLRKQVRAADRSGGLASLVLEALSLVLGRPRRAFIDRLASAGAATRLRKRAESGPRHMRLQAIAALGAFADSESPTCLKGLWCDPDSWVRLEALTASVTTRLAPGFDTAISRASAVGPELRGRARRLVRAVATANFESARGAVLRRDLPVWLRLELLEAFRRTPDAAMLPPLLTVAMDSDAELRASAVRRLGEIGSPDGHSAIIDAIDDPEWLVRVGAVSAAGALKLETARAHLGQRLGDTNWWVRLRASEAIRLLDETPLAAA